MGRLKKKPSHDHNISSDEGLLLIDFSKAKSICVISLLVIQYIICLCLLTVLHVDLSVLCNPASY